jgi:hypothetical protein
MDRAILRQIDHRTRALGIPACRSNAACRRIVHQLHTTAAATGRIARRLTTATVATPRREAEIIQRHAPTLDLAPTLPRAVQVVAATMAVPVADLRMVVAEAAFTAAVVVAVVVVTPEVVAAGIIAN